MTLKDAVARFVPDGTAVATGTPLESLLPFAATQEIIRQRKRDLTLIGPISDTQFDQMIGGGCVAKVVAAWVGNVSAGLAHCYRRAVEQGIPRPVTVEDHSNYTIALGLLAAAHGVPFMPTRSLLGSDIARDNPAFARSTSPWSDDPVLLVRAIKPDVAIIHVQRTDTDGNCHAWGNLGVTEEAGLAADRVILTAEEIVPRSVITSDPNRVLLPAFKVCAVVHCPGGAHPSPVQGHYRRDHAFYHEYHQATRTAEGMAKWLDTWVYGVADRAAYLEQLGAERWEALRRIQPAPAAPVDYGW